MPTRWYEGEVVKILARSPNTRSFWLSIDDIEDFAFIPGQFITLDLPIHEKRLNRWRSYSIANLPNQEGLIELCIVALDGGLASKYLFDEISVGSTLKFKGPDGGFIIQDRLDGQNLVMVCTGTGIAPFRSMLLDMSSKGPFTRDVHLIFGTRLVDDILYRDELEALAQKEERFTYSVALSREDDWEGYQGYVHQVYLEKYKEKDPTQTFLLCGWSMMVDEAVSNLIVKLGYDKSQVKYELYG